MWDIKSLFPYNPFPQYLNPRDSDWLLTQELIKAIRDESESHGAQFMFVILPQRNYLNGLYDPSIYQSLEKFAENEGMEYVNLLPELRSDHWANIFYSEDGHFTPFGARKASRLIFRKIQRMVTL